MNKVKCLLCPRGCELNDGDRGDCRSRMNIEGRLNTLAYARPCAVHVDPIEKKPFFHYLPSSKAFSIATAGCNLHCMHCQNWEISQSNPEDAMNMVFPPEEIVKQAINNNCRSIVGTYSEPIIFFEYCKDIAESAHKNNLTHLWVSAGYINPEPLKEALTFLDAVKIDLKSIRDDFYKKVCSATLEPVLSTIRSIRANNTWLEIVYLVIPTYNDTKEELSNLSNWIIDNIGPDVPLHFSKFWPMYRLKNLPPTPEDTLNMARTIALSKGINYVYVGNIPGHEGNNTYCPKCKKMVIKREGYTVLSFDIVSGLCKFCDNKIPGVWS